MHILLNYTWLTKKCLNQDDKYLSRCLTNNWQIVSTDVLNYEHNQSMEERDLKTKVGPPNFALDIDVLTDDLDKSIAKRMCESRWQIFKQMFDKWSTNSQSWCPEAWTLPEYGGKRFKNQSGSTEFCFRHWWSHRWFWQQILLKGWVR